jgi:hypothetical protein
MIWITAGYLIDYGEDDGSRTLELQLDPAIINPTDYWKLNRGSGSIEPTLNPSNFPDPSGAHQIFALLKPSNTPSSGKIMDVSTFRKHSPTGANSRAHKLIIATVIYSQSGDVI